MTPATATIAETPYVNQTINSRCKRKTFHFRMQLRCTTKDYGALLRKNKEFRVPFTITSSSFVFSHDVFTASFLQAGVVGNTNHACATSEFLSWNHSFVSPEDTQLNARNPVLAFRTVLVTSLCEKRQAERVA